MNTIFGDGKFTIEFAARKHLPEIIALGTETFRQHFERFPENFDEPTARKVYRKYNREFSRWSRFTGARAKTLCVALHGDRLAGYVMWDDNKGTGDALITDIETHPNYRKLGVAKALMLYAQNHLWEKGITRISSFVWDGNPASNNLHEQCGFRSVFVSYQILKPETGPKNS